MNELSRWNVQNVHKEVKKAIAQYCKEEGITQAKYLATDKRIRKYFSK
jgi:Replication regulatory protein RepB